MIVKFFLHKKWSTKLHKKIRNPGPPPFPFKYHLGIILTFWHCFPLLCDQNAYEGIPCPWCILAESCKFWLRATNICFLSITAAPWPSLPFWQDYTCCPLPLSRKIAFYFTFCRVPLNRWMWNEKKKIINYIYSLLKKCKLKILNTFLLDFALILKNNIYSRALIN